jgi:DNA replication and repair protein RecF
MKIQRVKCHNFRNIREADIVPSPKLNILVGKNAQGKSNLLESIFIFATGKSHRASKNEDMISFDSNHAEVSIDLEKKNNHHRLYLQLNDNKKTLSIDGATRKRVSDVIGYLNVVSFFPKDLDLISGGPKERRDFIDMEISQVKPSFYKLGNKYSRLIQQRNRFLKQNYQKEYQGTLLRSYNEQLIELGSQIVHKRIETLYKMSLLANLSHRHITETKENLVINYVSNIGFDDPLGKLNKITKEEIENLIKDKLESEQHREKERGTTLVGPHLDDFTCIVNGRDIKRFGSQGQMRTTVISLKLAELQYMKSETGELPILILDDVLSELDKERQHLLLNNASGSTQTFVATTDISLLNETIKKEASIYRVDGGKFHLES